MCELFGLSSAGRNIVNPYLKTLMKHSTEHPHGWGIAVFYGDSVSLEKEPKPAFVSDYLTSRLKHPMEARNMIAHIRLATRGVMSYENCHPFVRRDTEGRAWTLAHNGTIFSSDILDYYKDQQDGSTDSERILCHLINRCDRKIHEKGGHLSLEDRCVLMDEMIREIVPENKLNLLVYDGEALYVHTNMKGTLYFKQTEESIFFATKPEDGEGWKMLPMMQLFVYRNGKQIFEGIRHDFEYVKADTSADSSLCAGL